MSYLYEERLYGEALYSGPIVVGTWEQSYSFTYLAGTTVSLTLDAVYTQPEGTRVTFYAGQSPSEYEEITEGVGSPVLFTDKLSGAQNLYIKIEMEANDESLTPTVDSINLTVSQYTSLYTVAVTVLNDAFEDTDADYFIDPWLQNVPIEYSWLERQSHRDALGLIGDACGGVAYQDRYGIVRLESATYLAGNGSTPLFNIEQDRILDAMTPVSEVFNVIRVKTQPYTALMSQQVWELQGDNIINNGETRTFEIFFSDYEAVINASATLTSVPSGATLDSETWYTWGGRVTITGSTDNQELILTVDGQPLAVRGSRVVERSDGESIRENGERVYIIENNMLIQDAEIAGEIAEAVLATTKDARRDIDIDWRGDPTLELGDYGTADTITGNLVEQEIRYNGILSAKALVRRS